MNEQKQEITIEDVKKLLRGLDPITKKNVLSYAERMPLKEKYNFIKHFLKVKKLDTFEGMKKYQEARSYGCKGCDKK